MDALPLIGMTVIRSSFSMPWSLSHAANWFSPISKSRITTRPTAATSNLPSQGSPSTSDLTRLPTRVVFPALYWAESITLVLAGWKPANRQATSGWGRASNSRRVRISGGSTSPLFSASNRRRALSRILSRVSSFETSASIVSPDGKTISLSGFGG